jgi:DNA helicase HerA-like ATPase
MSEFKLPNSKERVVVFGRTGSGKTVFLTWLLSMASIDERPWIIIDHKNDGYLKNLPRVEKIKLGELPKQPGIYIVNPQMTQDEELDAYLHKILSKGNTGVFTDEGSTIPQREPRYVGLKSLFAQGRSKRTPILFATQRPSFLNQSVLSEGDYYAAFHLQHEPDRERAARFIPGGIEPRLDDYHSRWYDVKQDAHFVIPPVDEDQALERIDRRLKPRINLL